jgi:hypothetical protein
MRIGGKIIELRWSLITRLKIAMPLSFQWDRFPTSYHNPEGASKNHFEFDESKGILIPG